MELTSDSPQLVNSAGTTAVRSREYLRPVRESSFEQAWTVLAGPERESTAKAWLTLLKASEHCRPSHIAYAYVWKRWIDVIVATVALVTLAPLLLVTAIAIRLDSPGPVIFRQTRVGRNGTPFTVYKFRTMTHEPDQTLRIFKDEDGKWRHKVKDDPRITRVGKFIRPSSIDELPQLINVLRGEMSLVGPRPELPQIVQHYARWQHQRHLVRPGLTGWWQIQGRSDKPMHEHTDLDLYYVENLSFRLDLMIALRTVTIVAKGFGAF